MLANKFKIDFLELLRLFKVSFIFKDSLKYRKSTSVIYFRNPNNYSKYYIENCKIAEIL